MSDIHKHFLADFGHVIREQALEAKTAHEKARSTEDEAFQAGRAMAYYEVASLLVSQAQALQLPLEDLHLSGLDPDRDLL